MTHKTPTPQAALALASLLLSTVVPATLHAQVEHWRNGKQQPTLHPTIQAAVNAALPGDTLRIRPGTYHENIRINGKNSPADNPITLEPTDPTTPNSVIIDGADPELQRASPTNPLKRWTPIDPQNPAHGWQTTVPWTWTARESRALLTWASHADDRLIAAHHNQDFFDRSPRGDALWRTGTTVRLRLADGRNPNTLPLNIGTAEGIIQFTNSSGWTVRNLTLRHAGFAGIHLNGSGVTDITLQNLTIRTAFRAITTEDLGNHSKRITIRRCRVQNYWNFDWEWINGYRDTTSSSDEEVSPMRGHGIRLKAEDSEVTDCEIAGQWDGMMIQGRNIRVHRNLIHHTNDDMVELESGRSTDIHFYDNVGFKLFVGISVVSNRPGPIYIYRNRIQTTDTIRREGDTRRYGYPIKMGQDWGPGARGLYIYQNTFVSDGRSIFVGTRAPRYRPENWRDLAFVNNIFQRNRRAQPIGLEGMGPAANNIRWQGNLFTWDAELARLTELDPAYATAGIVADPRLTAPAADPVDARLSTPDSPARAAGSLLPIESDWPDSYPKPNDKRKPDIGAIPYETAPHTAGPGGNLYWPWPKN